MKDFIEELFKKYEFYNQDEFIGRYFFLNSDKKTSEFYLVDFIKEKNLTNYLNSSVFESVIEDFEKAKSISSEVEKNTSLIICVELDEMNKENIERVVRNIWSVEEDEYWFNKNVLLYDKEVLNEFVNNQEIYNTLLNIVNDEDAFENFERDVYWSSIYYFAIQLFIKIPFLNLSDSVNEFESLESILNEKKTNEQRYLVNLLGSNDENDSVENEFDRLEDALFDPKNNQFDRFINKFKDIDETD